uniref:C2H2-type domain-containing protein n=1 Tax=Timema tahoe TaxID=61484 RepID=A0A7R9ILK8_9NEOP|nr:unnamed protein product [Timema tahoe]
MGRAVVGGEVDVPVPYYSREWFQMVVLESGGMITTGSNQYLQPDYLSPLPTTLEVSLALILLYIQVVLLQLAAKKSPWLCWKSPWLWYLLYIQVVLLQLDAKKSPLALILLYIQVVLLQLEVPLSLLAAKKSPLALIWLYIQVVLLQLEVPLALVLLYIQVVLLQLDAKKSPLALILLYIQVELLQLEVPLALLAAKKSPLALILLYIQVVLLQLEVPLDLVLLYIQVELLQCAAKKSPLALMLYIQDVLLQLEVPLALVLLYIQVVLLQLDAKKSPLALLAQTCSQIGADSPNTKTLIPTLEKPSKKSSSVDTSVSPPVSVHKAPPPAQPLARTSPSEPRLAFKPYEANVLCKKMTSPTVEERPPSKTGSVNDSGEKGGRASSRKSAASPSVVVQLQGDVGKTPSGERVKSVSPSNTGGASPIIRSGLEVLQGHPKDMPLGTYKPSGLGGLGGSLGSLCSGCPPGLEPNNPAFRPPFAGGPFSHHHAALLAAGYPSASPGPYVSYARVKTASGGEALVPVCKDPYCTGCQYSLHNQQLLLGSCPSGCTQCDHQKPYVCNWIAGDSYCGKRFGTSDELLQHLRTHTTAADNSMSLLNPHAFLASSAAALHRAGYPNPPLSPLSARYHPYSKPGLPGSLAASPFSAFNPTTLGPYYSPYSLYGQRIGAAVHP